MITIGSLTVDIEHRQIFRGGEQPRIGSRAFDILAVLIAEKGSLVSKDDLLRKVWPTTIVEENNLQVHMSTLRKLLRDCDVTIQTVPGRGYRLVESKPRQRPDGTEEPEPTAGKARNRTTIVNNLPIYGADIIGRDVEASDISRALKTHQVVTLVGAGGIGKTRLAVEVARLTLLDFPGGVYFVSLASALERSAVLDCLFSALGAKPSAGPLSLARIGKELGELPVLFVLDNCEQVLEAAAELAEILAGVAPPCDRASDQPRSFAARQ